MTLPPALARALADLSLRELAQAAFGEADVTGRSEATILADALDAPAAVLALDGAAPGRLRVAARARWDAAPDTVPAEGALADALAHGAPVVLDPVPPALAAAGVGGGLVVRIGSADRPFALVGVFPPAPRAMTAAETRFLQAAAAALHARFALDDTRRALTESRALALSLFNTTVDGVITIDDRGHIVSFNAGAERIFGFTAAEVMGHNVSVLMPEPYRTEHDGYMDAYERTGVGRIIGIGREVVGRRKAGTTFPMDLAVSEVQLAGKRLFTGIVRDISERRALEREVLRVVEGERRRIGQDLHDGLGQQITAVGLFLRALARRLDAETSALAPDAHRLVAMVDEADAFARGLARSLVPVELEQNGLEAALVRMADRASALYGAAVTAETTGSGPAEASALHADAATNLFWIAQEAVSNAVQHGHAREIRIRLVRGTDRLRLRVEDDGRGIDVTLRPGGPLDATTDGAAGPPPELRGMGLRIMTHRAHLAGGTLDLRPGAEGGTVVTCTVPLRGPGFYPA